MNFSKSKLQTNRKSDKKKKGRKKWKRFAYFVKNLVLMRFIDALNREILNRLLHPPFIHSLPKISQQIYESKPTKTFAEIRLSKNIDWKIENLKGDWLRYRAFPATNGFVYVVVVHRRCLSLKLSSACRFES